MSPSHWIPSAAPPSSSSTSQDEFLGSHYQQRDHALHNSGPSLTSSSSSSSLCVPIHSQEGPVDPPRRDPSSPIHAAAIDRQPLEEGYESESLARPPESSSEKRSNVAPQSMHHQHHHHHHHHEYHRQRAASAASAAAAAAAASRLVKHKRRYCRIPGCKSIVKSQGVCQRHGAKPRMCRVATCTKQAQGNFDGMCKVHYKAIRNTSSVGVETGTIHISNSVPSRVGGSESNASVTHSTANGVAHSNTRHGPLSSATTDIGSLSGTPPPRSSSSDASDEHLSVYDGILPASLAWRMGGGATSTRRGCGRDGGDDNEDSTRCPAEAPSGGMPLVEFLARNGTRKSKGWHRRQERRARGYPPWNPDPEVEDPQWDDWERELIWTELLLLMGTNDRSNALMSHLAHAWGCLPGFHTAFIAQWIGERQTAFPMEYGAGNHDGDYADPDNEATASEGDDGIVDIDDIVDDDAGYDDEVQDEVMNLSETGATPVIGADAWDDACYTANSYNEALASDLLLDHLANSSPQHTPADHRHRGEGNDGDDDDDDQDRVTDDASCSSREEVRRAQISNE